MSEEAPPAPAAMPANEPEKPKKGCGCLAWTVVLVVGALMASLFAPTYGLITPRANQMKTSSNARQIVGLLMTYASDYSGSYPDALLKGDDLTANAVFRELFKDGLVQDETVFGSPWSSFIPDKEIGSAPDFPKALEPGENHWAYVAGLSNTSQPHFPLVMESTVDGKLPPKWLLPSSKLAWWLAKTLDQPLPSRPPGRTWEDGKIIVARNDASVETVKLIEKDGFMHLPESFFKPEGKEPLPPLKLLDVARKQEAEKK